MLKWNQFLENIITTKKNVDYTQIQTIYNKAHIAVDLVNMYKPELLAGVSVIANLASGAYGVYNSGEDQPKGDTIHVNVKRIMNEKKSDTERIIELASTLVHEATHEIEYNTKGRSDETGPKQAETAFMSWLQNNWNMIMQSFPELNVQATKQVPVGT